MSYGDHWIVSSPKQRWCVLVGYWFILSLPLGYYGYYAKLLDAEGDDTAGIVIITPIHFLSIVLHVLFISLFEIKYIIRVLKL